ncbi:unnamed protein product, partial [Vitis vinifera]|uniref:Uncharacterized protein n=1 Tax=Vitis vinifera TaxID=29760 RepID=D7U9D8_VITVI
MTLKKRHYLKTLLFLPLKRQDNASLKSIKLSHSQHLTKTPDFSGVPNLRRLILKGCTSLVENCLPQLGV